MRLKIANKMKVGIPIPRMILFLIFFGFLSSAMAADPWYINTKVTVTTPMDVGEVIVFGNGSLTVQDVPEPGFRLSGHLIAADDSRVDLINSVIKILSTYHGQYLLGAMGRGTMTVDGCDYQIPNQVQHPIIALENSKVEVKNSDFGFAQFFAGGEAILTASKLNGNFECLVQDSGRMELNDIPRNQGMGGLWVWPTFMPGSQAVYTPPLPGFISNYTFPPPDATGISQSFTLQQCNVVLWPMLVREGSDLTIKDVPQNNWVVVGLHLPSSVTISGLLNGQTYDNVDLGLSDRQLRLQNASIDSWNLYPEAEAQVIVENSLIGELLASGNSSVVMRNTIVDGTGGFFGVSDQAVLDATNCTFTCTVQASKEASAALHYCQILPYPSDPTGAFTYYGAYDTAKLHLDHTMTQSTPVLGGSGALAVTWIIDPPSSPPSRWGSVELHGYAAIYTLDSSASIDSWTLKTHQTNSWWYRQIGSGKTNVEGGSLGTWRGIRSNVDHELVLELKDESGSTYTSKVSVPAQ